MRDSRAGDYLNQFDRPEPLASFTVDLTFDGYSWIANFNPDCQEDITFTQTEGSSLPIALINLAQLLQAALSRTKSGTLESSELAKMLGISYQEAIAILSTYDRIQTGTDQHS